MSEGYSIKAEASYPSKKGDNLLIGDIPQIDFKRDDEDCGGVRTNGEFSLTVHETPDLIIKITCKSGYVLRLKDNEGKIAYCLLCEKPEAKDKWLDIEGNLHRGADCDNEFTEADIDAIAAHDSRLWQNVYTIEELNGKGELMNLYRCVKTKPQSLQPDGPKVVCQDGLRFEILEDEDICLVSEDESSPQETLVIPDKYDGFDVRIADEMEFSSSKILKEITLPSNATYIGNISFKGCRELSKVVWPDSIEWIGFYAFSGCASLTELVFPKSLKSILNKAFEGCTSLKRVKLPDGFTSIGESAFKNCKSLEDISLPESVTEIGDGAFEGCLSLKNIKLPESITKGLSEKEIQDYLSRITNARRPSETQK